MDFASQGEERMKILMVNKFFYIKGGSETYYFALKRLLEAKGHTVIDFSMKNEKNFDSPYREYFVEAVDYNGGMSRKQQLKAARNIIYSTEAKHKLEKLIQDTKPDIAHLHIFQHQLSPSILDVLKKYDIPTVYTAHDLKMLCLNYVMMTHGQLCEKCKGGHYLNCLKKKCVKNSALKSSINVLEGYLHKWRKSYDAIDVILTPSMFYKNKFLDFGIDKERVYHLPNFLDRECPEVETAQDKEQYFLYFGRLSAEKGILTLIKAVKNTKNHLYIAGTGPCLEEIEQYLKEYNMTNVKLLGFKSGKELIDIVGNARAVILPSEWYENGPYSAIESLQLGRPVIGSELGGIPELIDGNGKVFRHGDVEALREILEQFPSPGTSDYQRYCRRSKEIFAKNYMAEGHYEKLLPMYEKAMQKHGNERSL